MQATDELQTAAQYAAVQGAPLVTAEEPESPVLGEDEPQLPTNVFLQNLPTRAHPPTANTAPAPVMDANVAASNPVDSDPALLDLMHPSSGIAPQGDVVAPGRPALQRFDALPGIPGLQATSSPAAEHAVPVRVGPVKPVSRPKVQHKPLLAAVKQPMKAGAARRKSAPESRNTPTRPNPVLAGPRSRSSGKKTPEEAIEAAKSKLVSSLRALGMTLPDNWRFTANQRKNGASKGDFDVYFFDGKGKRYRSYKEALQAIQGILPEKKPKAGYAIVLEPVEQTLADGPASDAELHPSGRWLRPNRMKEGFKQMEAGTHDRCAGRAWGAAFEARGLFDGNEGLDMLALAADNVRADPSIIPSPGSVAVNALGGDVGQVGNGLGQPGSSRGGTPSAAAGRHDSNPFRAALNASMNGNSGQHDAVPVSRPAHATRPRSTSGPAGNPGSSLNMLKKMGSRHAQPGGARQAGMSSPIKNAQPLLRKGDRATSQTPEYELPAIATNQQHSEPSTKAAANHNSESGTTTTSHPMIFTAVQPQQQPSGEGARPGSAPAATVAKLAWPKANTGQAQNPTAVGNTATTIKLPSLGADTSAAQTLQIPVPPIQPKIKKISVAALAKGLNTDGSLNAHATLPETVPSISVTAVPVDIIAAPANVTHPAAPSKPSPPHTSAAINVQAGTAAPQQAKAADAKAPPVIETAANTATAGVSLGRGAANAAKAAPSLPATTTGPEAAAKTDAALALAANTSTKSAPVTTPAAVTAPGSNVASMATISTHKPAPAPNFKPPLSALAIVDPVATLLSAPLTSVSAGHAAAPYNEDVAAVAAALAETATNLPPDAAPRVFPTVTSGLTPSNIALHLQPVQQSHHDSSHLGKPHARPTSPSFRSNPFTYAAAQPSTAALASPQVNLHATGNTISAQPASLPSAAAIAMLPVSLPIPVPSLPAPATHAGLKVKFRTAPKSSSVTPTAMQAQQVQAPVMNVHAAAVPTDAQDYITTPADFAAANADTSAAHPSSSTPPKSKKPALASEPATAPPAQAAVPNRQAEDAVMTDSADHAASGLKRPVAQADAALPAVDNLDAQARQQQHKDKRQRTQLADEQPPAGVIACDSQEQATQMPTAATVAAQQHQDGQQPASADPAVAQQPYQQVPAPKREPDEQPEGQLGLSQLQVGPQALPMALAQARTLLRQGVEALNLVSEYVGMMKVLGFHANALDTCNEAVDKLSQVGALLDGASGSQEQLGALQQARTLTEQGLEKLQPIAKHFGMMKVLGFSAQTLDSFNAAMDKLSNAQRLLTAASQ